MFSFSLPPSFYFILFLFLFLLFDIFPHFRVMIFGCFFFFLQDFSIENVPRTWDNYCELIAQSSGGFTLNLTEAFMCSFLLRTDVIVYTCVQEPNEARRHLRPLSESDRARVLDIAHQGLTHYLYVIHYLECFYGISI